MTPWRLNFLKINSLRPKSPFRRDLLLGRFLLV
jgi:hypothetical protein